tara:strand:+ start:141 stop:800 length:660 start_codon:yes stop_codon:yes gene_type:complete
MIKNIIFDFDGVLVDSEILVARAFTKYMLNLGVKINEKEFASYAGKKTIQVIETLSQKYFINDKKKFFDDIINISTNIYKKDLTTVEGAYKFVNETNFNLYIGSNSNKKRILDGLYKVKLDKFFKPEQVYSFDIVKNPKPYPDVYLKAVEDNQLNKDETVIIEDSVVGVKAGCSANIRVIGLTAGGHWFENRDDKDLLKAGAIAVTNNYKKIKEIIESY